MFKKVQKALKFIFFLAVGIIIFWWIYKDQDIEMIKSVLRNDVNYIWIWVSLVLGILSHISRAIRWQCMIEPLGYKPGLRNTFLAVMVGYVMNMVIPRMGEISRCGVLARYENISFPRLVGTVVTERIIDVLMLLLFTLLTIVTQFGQILSFVENNPSVKDKAWSMISSPFLWGGITIFIILMLILRNKIKYTAFYRKIEHTIIHLKEGLISFRYVEKKGTLIFHSFFIWSMYYLMLYSAFMAFDFTSGLSPFAGLTTFIMGSFGMVAPVQGGLGTWHFMTKEALSLYGISNDNGVIFAFVAHTTNTLLVLFLGLISLVALPLINRKK